jgi:hypothetical protein
VTDSSRLSNRPEAQRSVCRIKRLKTTRNFGSKIKHRDLEPCNLFFDVFGKNGCTGDSISVHKISSFVEHFHRNSEKGVDPLYQRVYDNFVEPSGLALAEFLSCACAEGVDGKCQKCQELKERNRNGNPAEGLGNEDYFRAANRRSIWLGYEAD